MSTTGPDANAIRVWSYEDAPHQLQRLSTAGGERWLAFVPPAVADRDGGYPLWLDSLDSEQDPEVIELNGALVVIGGADAIS